MAESQYAKYILKEPKGQLHDGTVFEGFLASPEKLGLDCQILSRIMREYKKSALKPESLPK